MTQSEINERLIKTIQSGAIIAICVVSHGDSGTSAILHTDKMRVSDMERTLSTMMACVYKNVATIAEHLGCSVRPLWESLIESATALKTEGGFADDPDRYG